jgi:hypothetical protein
LCLFICLLVSLFIVFVSHTLVHTHMENQYYILEEEGILAWMQHDMFISKSTCGEDVLSALGIPKSKAAEDFLRQRNVGAMISLCRMSSKRVVIFVFGDAFIVTKDNLVPLKFRPISPVQDYTCVLYENGLLHKII